MKHEYAHTQPQDTDGLINTRKSDRRNMRASAPSDTTALNMVSIPSWHLLSCPHRLAWPRTLPFQGSNTGSNPVGDTRPFNVGYCVEKLPSNDFPLEAVDLLLLLDLTPTCSG
jgi:hypothetical protein